MFSPEGGGLNLTIPNPAAFTDMTDGIALPGQPTTSGKTNIWIECNEDMVDWGIGTSAPERSFHFLNLKQSVCRAYNKALGITGIPGEDGGVDVTGHDYTYCYKQSAGPNTGDYEIFVLIHVG